MPSRPVARRASLIAASTASVPLLQKNAISNGAGEMATSFSVAPLRVATYLGFLLSGVSVLMILFVVVSRLTHPDFAPGWASLMAAILLIGGIQTFCIGLIGEYLGRTYLKINGKWRDHLLFGIVNGA